MPKVIFAAIAVAAGLVFAVLAGYCFALSRVFPVGDGVTEQTAIAMRGQFGDMFGAVNAAFSSLAFFVLAAGVVVQWIEQRRQDDRHSKEQDLATLATYANCFDDIIAQLDRQIDNSAARRARFAQGPEAQAKMTADWAEHEQLKKETQEAIERDRETYKAVLQLINVRVQQILLENRT